MYGMKEIHRLENRLRGMRECHISMSIEDGSFLKLKLELERDTTFIF